LFFYLDQAIRQLEYSVFKKSMFGTASDDGAVTLWDANARRVLHSFKDAHVGPATGIAFSPINEMLMVSVGLDKRLVCYDIHKKQ
jgi:protein NEDD1